MTASERIKTARAFAALARPLMSRVGGWARNGAEMLQDFRPGSGLIQPLQRLAGGATKKVDAADAYKATLGKWGQRALGAGQFAAGVAPGAAMVGGLASGVVSPWLMPVWNTAMNAGRAGGQMFGWRDPAQTKQWIEQGANDTILGVHNQLAGASIPERMQYLSAMGNGSWLDPSMRASRVAAGQQLRQPSIGQFLPSQGFSPGGSEGGGDMSNWLMQRAMQQQAEAAAMNKGASVDLSKSARFGALLNLFRGGSRALGRSGVPFRPQAFPVPMRPPTTMQNIGKWGWRGAKSTAGAAALPLAVGGLGGYFNADLDAQAVGADMALSGMQQGMANAGGFKRTMVAMDPSLMLQQAQGMSPNLFNRYQQVYGQPFQPGMIGSLQQWAGNMGKELKNPTFLAADSSGIRNIPTT